PLTGEQRDGSRHALTLTAALLRVYWAMGPVPAPTARRLLSRSRRRGLHRSPPARARAESWLSAARWESVRAAAGLRADTRCGGPRGATTNRVPPAAGARAGGGW